MTKIKQFLREHYFAVLAALFFAGLISVLPQIIFIRSLGAEYRGIHFFQTPNEDAYIAMMQEVLDGYPSVASMPFWEYKNSLPLLPPAIPIIYAAASRLFGVSLINVVIASKFILPALLFFLAYSLIYKLSEGLNLPYRKFGAIAGGLLVSLGLELSDYNSVFKYLTGRVTPTDFLIWTRPVNPISGAILIFLFLLCVWSLVNKGKIFYIIIAAASLALAMASYFFSWSLGLAIMGVFGLIFLLKKENKFILKFLSIIFLALLFSLPHWIMVWKAGQMQYFAEASARIGLLVSQAPHFNKFLFAAFLVFAAISAWHFFRKKERIPLWWWFCLAIFAGGLIAYNQQVITGKEIWYYHYSFYTTPLAEVALLIALWHFVRPRWPRLWLGFIFLISVASIVSAVHIQSAVYKKYFADYKEKQKYADVFDFLNNNAPKDCVVLVDDNGAKNSFWHKLIPAFTHCNTYFSDERTSVIAPPDRFYHNYLSLLRIRGINAEEIDKYLVDNQGEPAGYLYYQLQYSLGYKDLKLEEVLKKLPGDYKEFVKRDFYKELKKYRIDYILSVGPLDKMVIKSLPTLQSVFEKNNFYIYTLK